MANILKNNNIKAIMIDTPIGKKENSFNYDKNMQLINKYIDISNIFHVKYLRIFSNVGKENTIDSVKETLTEMKEIISGYKIELLIENEKETLAESAEQCYELIKNIEKINILFDVENSYAKGFDVLEEYEKYKGKIKYLHIRDYNKIIDKYTYIGEGTIPLMLLFEKIKKDGSKVIVSLETMLPKFNKINSKKELFINSFRCLKKFLR